MAEIKAYELAKQQREISISEFFLKNRHLLGFDNPTRALMMVVKEAVDNSLDAAEEMKIANILGGSAEAGTPAVVETDREYALRILSGK